MPFRLQCMKVKSESEVAQSCPTLSDPMDCGPPGSPIHGIFQARVLEWGAIGCPLLKQTLKRLQNVHGATLHTNLVLENLFLGSNQLYMLTCNEFIIVIF